jgi:hypothetical protein
LPPYDCEDTPAAPLSRTTTAGTPTSSSAASPPKSLHPHPLQLLPRLLQLPLRGLNLSLCPHQPHLRILKLRQQLRMRPLKLGFRRLDLIMERIIRKDIIEKDNADKIPSRYLHPSNGLHKRLAAPGHGDEYLGVAGVRLRLREAIPLIQISERATEAPEVGAGVAECFIDARRARFMRLSASERSLTTWDSTLSLAEISWWTCCDCRTLDLAASSSRNSGVGPSNIEA